MLCIVLPHGYQVYHFRGAGAGEFGLFQPLGIVLEWISDCALSPLFICYPMIDAKAHLVNEDVSLGTSSGIVETGLSENAAHLPETQPKTPARLADMV